jgi:hypothetical protein
MGLDVPVGRIDPSLEKQFNKALAALVARKVVHSQQLAPAGWADLAEHHPYQTTRLELRHLREQLLPFVPRERALYDVAANEEHILRGRNHPELVEAWTQIESGLRCALANRPQSDALFHLLVRGRQLFGARRIFGTAVTCNAPFTGLVDELTKRDLVPATLLDPLERLRVAALPAAELQRQQHKSSLLPIGNFGGTGGSSLNQHTKDELFRAKPELVASLPGHEEPEPVPGFGESIGDSGRRYSPLLDQLVDRNAFRMLQFLSA